MAIVTTISRCTVVLAVSLFAGVASARDAPELARQVRLEVQTTPESLAVGDRWTVQLAVEAPPGFEVRFPQALPRSSDADLIEYLPPDKPVAGSGGLQRWTARYTLALFKVGPVSLPPWSVEVRHDSLQTVASTDSLRTFVTTVLDDSLAAAGLRDLKAQAQLAVSKWPWIAGGLVAAAAVVAFILWRRRRGRRAAIVPLPRQRPADEVALEQLRRLETRRLPLDGRFTEHWVALSEIVRRYLEDGFGVAALEETTEEILFDLERHGFDRAHVLRFRALSQLGDLIKFAKREPTIEECVQALDRTRDFVVATSPRLRVLPAPGGDAA